MERRLDAALGARAHEALHRGGNLSFNADAAFGRITHPARLGGLQFLE